MGKDGGVCIYLKSRMGRDQVLKFGDDGHQTPHLHRPDHPPEDWGESSNVIQHPVIGGEATPVNGMD